MRSRAVVRSGALKLRLPKSMPTDRSSSARQVIESSKRWWKCRNRFDQIGFVPFNILDPVTHIDTPAPNKPPSVRHTHTHGSPRSRLHTPEGTQLCFSSQAPAPPPLAKTFSAVPPSSNAHGPTHSPKHPHGSPQYGQRVPAGEDQDNKGTGPLSGRCVASCIRC